jgi:hypothetical protein
MAAQAVLKGVQRRPGCYRASVWLQPLQHTGGQFADFESRNVGTEVQCGFRCSARNCSLILTPGGQLVRRHAAFKRVLYLHD